VNDEQALNFCKNNHLSNDVSEIGWLVKLISDDLPTHTPRISTSAELLHPSYRAGILQNEASNTVPAASIFFSFVNLDFIGVSAL